MPASFMLDGHLVRTVRIFLGDDMAIGKPADTRLGIVKEEAFRTATRDGLWSPETGIGPTTHPDPTPSEETTVFLCE